MRLRIFGNQDDEEAGKKCGDCRSIERIGLIEAEKDAAEGARDQHGGKDPGGGVGFVTTVCVDLVIAMHGSQKA